MTVYITMGFMEKAQLLVPGRGHGQASLERAKSAAEYHRRFGTNRIVFSGGSWILGKPGHEKSEATIMFEHVREQLCSCRVILEHDADNSFANILNSMSHLDPSLPLGIVTHGDHMARVMLLAKKMLPNKQIFPVVVPSRCSFMAWTAQALACELARVAYLGADKSNIDHMCKRNNALKWMKAKFNLLHNS